MTDSRSIETDDFQEVRGDIYLAGRETNAATEALDRIAAERDSFIEDAQTCEREHWDRSAVQGLRERNDALITDRNGANARIESLVGEREELREALLKHHPNWDSPYPRGCEVCGYDIDSVLSSRETTDSPEQG